MKNVNYPRIHDVCKEILFAIPKSREFFCRKCQARITVLDSKGERIGSGNNPIITNEQIKTIMKSITTPGRKVIYKLVVRPHGGNTA